MSNSPVNNSITWLHKAGACARLFRWHQPIGIWLLLWPCLIVLLVASSGQPSIEDILLFVVGSIASRSAGCAINDLCDRKIDSQVERTKLRPLASGELEPWQAVVAFVLALTLCLLVAVYLDLLLLSLIAVLLLSIYPLSKRIFSHPQIVLSLTYGVGIPMAWVVGGKSLTEPLWILFYCANMCWVYSYDTQYAMADKPWDEKLSINSSAISLGRYDILGIICAQLVTLLLIGLWIWQTQGGLLTYGALVLVAIGFIWQDKYIQKRTIERCITAFRSNHRLQLLLLTATVIDYSLVVK